MGTVAVGVPAAAPRTRGRGGGGGRAGGGGGGDDGGGTAAAGDAATAHPSWTARWAEEGKRGHGGRTGAAPWLH